MTVRVLIFGSLARELDCKFIAVEVSQPTTVRHINEALAEIFPTKQAFFRSARLAVNHNFAAANLAVHASDEVALIELVGGG